MANVESAVANHSAAWERMLAGDWPGVDPEACTRAVALARMTSRERPAHSIGAAVIAEGRFPYGEEDRAHLEAGDWKEFLVVVTDGARVAAIGAGVSQELVNALGNDPAEVERCLLALLDDSIGSLAKAEMPEPTFAFEDLLMHVGPLLFAAPIVWKLGLLPSS
jgi:hypothetical protein